MAAKSGGCFPGSSTVILSDGQTKPVKDLQLGDKVLAADLKGNIVSSDILMFMDLEKEIKREFYVLETEEPRRKLTLTPAHLVFVTNNGTDRSDAKAVFASNVLPGQKVLVMDDTNTDNLKAVIVKRIYVEEQEGSYAPVTSHGTIIIDQVLVSCYAVVEDHSLAHWAFAPVRLVRSFMSVIGTLKELGGAHQSDGMHWYSDLLYHISTWILDSSSFHPLGMPQS